MNTVDELGEAPRRGIEGEVSILRCGWCKREFPTFTFSGDTDALTIGLVCASSSDSRDLILAELPSNEICTHDESLTAFESRLAFLLERDDLRVPRVLRFEKPPSLAGLSFDDFRRSWARPMAVFRCLCCTTGEAVAMREMSIKAFEDEGGHVMVMRGLHVIG